MNQKLIFTILFVTVSLFSFGQDIIDEDQCEKLKKQRIDFSRTDFKHLQQQIYKLMDCGFDSIDCKIAGPILGTIMAERSNQNGDKIIEFGYLIAQLNRVRNSKQYAEIRKEMMNPKETINKVPAFLNYPQHFDLEESKKSQKILKKSLLIYFSAINGINARIMERDVLSDPSILGLLDNFIIVTLYVDDKKVGKINSKIQVEKYQGNVQPDFIIQSINGEWRRICGYCTKEEFEKLLNNK